MAKYANVPNLPCCEHRQLLRAAWREYGAWQKCQTIYETFVSFWHHWWVPVQPFFGLYGAEYRSFQITQNGCWGMKGMMRWFCVQFDQAQNIDTLVRPFTKRCIVKPSDMTEGARVPISPQSHVSDSYLLRCVHVRLGKKCWTTYETIVCFRHTDGFTMHRFLIRKGPITDDFRLPKLVVGEWRVWCDGFVYNLTKHHTSIHWSGHLSNGASWNHRTWLKVYVYRSHRNAT